MKTTIHQANREIKRSHDTLLILGDGHWMFADMQTFLDWQIPHDVGSLGRSIKEYPGKVLHWFNADGDLSIQWAKNLPNGNGTIKHTMGEVEGFDVDWNIDQPDYRNGEITGEGPTRMHGSSSLFATLAGLEMGYEKIILAGCPLDTEGHYYFPQSKETLGPIWLGFDFMAWIDFAEMEEADKVRSMSGYTAKIIGKTTKEWIND
jgi:hypothetical protein